MMKACRQTFTNFQPHLLLPRLDLGGDDVGRVVRHVSGPDGVLGKNMEKNTGLAPDHDQPVFTVSYLPQVEVVLQPLGQEHWHLQDHRVILLVLIVLFLVICWRRFSPGDLKGRLRLSWPVRASLFGHPRGAGWGESVKGCLSLTFSKVGILGDLLPAGDPAPSLRQLLRMCFAPGV